MALPLARAAKGRQLGPGARVGAPLATTAHKRPNKQTPDCPSPRPSGSGQGELIGHGTGLPATEHATESATDAAPKRAP
eukprot:8695864-Alexandrium_andersonii.AAC.1